MAIATFNSAVRWNLIGSILRICVTFLLNLVLLRVLGPEVAGQFAIFLIIIGIGTILSEGGMMAVIAGSPAITEAVLRNCLFLILCYSSVISLVLLGISDTLGSLFNLPPGTGYLPLVAVLNIIPLGISSIPLSMLRRQYRSLAVQVIQGGAYVIGFGVVALPIALQTHSVLAYAIGFSVQTLVVVVAAIVVSRCPLIPLARGSSAIQKVSARALLTNFTFYLAESAGGILTAHLLGARATGLYSTAINLLRTPTDAIGTSLHAPLLVSAAQDNGGPSTRRRFLSVLNIISTTIFACFFSVFLCGREIVLVLLGPKWMDAGPVLTIVGLLMMFRLLSTLSGAVLWGRGGLLLDFCAQGMALLVILLGFLILQPQGAVVVTEIVAASVAARMVIQLTAAARACSIGLGMIFHALVGPSLLSAVVMMPMLWIGPATVPSLGPLGIALLGAAGTFLLGVRVMIGIAHSDYDWAVAARRRLRFGGGAG